MSAGRKENAQRLIRASRLVERIENADGVDEVTKQLRTGWYRKRLQSLAEAEELEKMAHVNRGMPGKSPYRKWEITGFKDISSSGCAKDQCTNGRMYLKVKIVNFSCEHRDSKPSTCFSRRSFPLPAYRFPTWRVHPTGHVSSVDSKFLDVQYGTNLVSPSTHLSLQRKLEILGEKRQDSPAPKYHNIIDPNVGSFNRTWVPTELQASASHTGTVGGLHRACEEAAGGVSLPEGFLQNAMSIHDPPCHAGARAEIRNPIPDLHPLRNAQLYLAIEDVFEAALPLSARMQLPALLLPGALQAVVKAQRIVLKDGEMYSGVWHEDGLREHVVAVIRYYYRVSPTLQGGHIEIASKERTCVLGVGDNSEYPFFTEDGARQGIDEFQNLETRRKSAMLENKIRGTGTKSFQDSSA